ARDCLSPDRAAGVARSRRRAQCHGDPAATPASPAAGHDAKPRRAAGSTIVVQTGRCGLRDGAGRAARRAGKRTAPQRRGHRQRACGGLLVQSPGRRLGPAAACRPRPAGAARARDGIVNAPAAAPAAGHAQPALDARLAAGLLGIFIAAMAAGINNRVGALALVDIRGAGGFGLDDASWITTAYTAGELIAMPLAPWFAVTLSLRRFHLQMLAAGAAIAGVLPFVHDLRLLLLLRGLQGMASGALIPLLMM